MILNKDQLLVIKLNANVLLETGATEVIGGLCLECGTPMFANRDAGVHLCGYCGAGPFKAEARPRWSYPFVRPVERIRAWFGRRHDRNLSG